MYKVLLTAAVSDPWRTCYSHSADEETEAQREGVLWPTVAHVGAGAQTLALGGVFRGHLGQLPPYRGGVGAAMAPASPWGVVFTPCVELPSPPWNPTWWAPWGDSNPGLRPCGPREDCGKQMEDSRKTGLSEITETELPSGRQAAEVIKGPGLTPVRRPQARRVGEGWALRAD